MDLQTGESEGPFTSQRETVCASPAAGGALRTHTNRDVYYVLDHTLVNPHGVNSSY